MVPSRSCPPPSLLVPNLPHLRWSTAKTSPHCYARVSRARRFIVPQVSSRYSRYSRRSDPPRPPFALQSRPQLDEVAEGGTQQRLGAMKVNLARILRLPEHMRHLGKCQVGGVAEGHQLAVIWRQALDSRRQSLLEIGAFHLPCRQRRRIGQLLDERYRLAFLVVLLRRERDGAPLAEKIDAAIANGTEKPRAQGPAQVEGGKRGVELHEALLCCLRRVVVAAQQTIGKVEGCALVALDQRRKGALVARSCATGQLLIGRVFGRHRVPTRYPNASVAQSDRGHRQAPAARACTPAAAAPDPASAAAAGAGGSSAKGYRSRRWH